MTFMPSRVARLIVFLVVAALSIPVTAIAAGDAVLTNEFIYDEASFPSCHASTIEHTPAGLVAAWFGGTDEGEPDVGIWVARRTLTRVSPRAFDWIVTGLLIFSGLWLLR